MKEKKTLSDRLTKLQTMAKKQQICLWLLNILKELGDHATNLAERIIERE